MYDKTRRLHATMLGLGAMALALLPDTSALGQTEGQTLTALPGEVGAWFGNSVGLSGNTAIVGAPLEGDGIGVGNPSDAGAAYVFFNGGTWSQTRLVANDRAANDRFGYSVAVSGDWAAVGAPDDDAGGGTNCGSVYLFQRSGSNWSNTPQKIVGASGADRFGVSLAIDGTRLVVGASNASGTGRVYVYDLTGTTWMLTETLSPAGLDAGDEFGLSVALSGDTILAGARNDDHTIGSGGTFSYGAVYVFALNGSWGLQDVLHASDASHGDQFGHAVAVRGDVAAIGAPLNDGVGAVYVFDRSNGDWSQSAMVQSAAASGNDQLGYSVNIDGDLMVAGARLGGGGAGYVALFRRSGNSWPESSCTLVPFSTIGPDEYGSAVALDGTTMLAGAPGNDVQGSEAGSATFFEIVSALDSDGDGLTDDEEACLAHALGGSCPDPLDPDSDNDGVSDGLEQHVNFTDVCIPDNPGGPDFDSDGIPDTGDNCPSIANTDQANFDGDSAGDACDPDDDNDGLDDLDEVPFGSNPFDFDSDNDTLSDGVEFGLGTNPNSSDSDGDLLSDAAEAPCGCPHPTVADSDGDGLGDGIENNAGWDPCDADTDGDGLADGDEDDHGTGVLDPDSDNDGLMDGAEVALATTQPCVDPLDPDSDNDTILDGDEVTAGSGPCDLDSDHDGLADGLEAGHGTSAMNPDCDGDELLDGAEVDSGCSDPLDPDTDGDTLLDGDEVEAGTSPCNSDTDGDTLADNTDNDPLEFSATVLATMTLSARDTAQTADVSEYFGPNENVRTVRRTILSAQITLAAAAIEHGNYGAAEALLTLALNRVDGDTPPADWMTDGCDKTHLRNDLIELIEIINLID